MCRYYLIAIHLQTASVNLTFFWNSAAILDLRAKLVADWTKNTELNPSHKGSLVGLLQITGTRILHGIIKHELDFPLNFWFRYRQIRIPSFNSGLCLITPFVKTAHWWRQLSTLCTETKSRTLAISWRTVLNYCHVTHCDRSFVIATKYDVISFSAITEVLDGMFYWRNVEIPSTQGMFDTAGYTCVLIQ